MKKIIPFYLILFFLICFAFAKENFSYIPFKSAKWESKTTMDSPAGKQVLYQTVYFKSGKMRIEGKDVSNNKFITIIDKNYVYVINPEQKQGIKYPVESKQNPEKNNLELEKCRKNAKRIGSEKINNIDCDVIEYDCVIDNIKFEIKEWKSKKDNFVLKSITKVEGTSTTTEILKLKKDAKIPDNIFIPDKNIKFTSMDGILKSQNLKGKNIPDEKKMKEMMKQMPSE